MKNSCEILTDCLDYTGGGRYSDNRYSDISIWVMQWVRVGVRVRVRISDSCPFSAAFCRNNGWQNSGLYPDYTGWSESQLPAVLTTTCSQDHMNTNPDSDNILKT